MQKRTKKIQIELTSKQGENWTWRKVGARQPKGEIAGKLLPNDTELGDEIWVEAITELDGVFVESVLSGMGADKDGKGDNQKNGTERLELLGPKGAFKPVNLITNGSTSQQTKKKARKRKPKEKPVVEQPQMPDSKVEKRSAGPKLSPKHTHRNAWVESLSDVERPIAEQLMHGGLSEVRSAIKEDESITSGKELLALAEKLQARLMLVEWRDRGDAALENVGTVRLSDLRSVLAGAEGLRRNKDVREISEKLREKLMERVEHEHQTWLEDINTLLDEERVVRALNLSSRPPKAGSPLPEDLAEKLITRTNEALTSNMGDRRWINFLDAIYRSPISQYIQPIGVPNNPSSDLLERVKRHNPQIQKAFASQESEGNEAQATTNSDK